MDELIERLEKAGGPDRELDGAIWWAAKRAQAVRFFWNASPGLPGPTPDALPDSGLGRHAVVHASPRYTASLDAALTLYQTRPEWMPTNPRIACIDALRANARALKTAE